MKLWVDPDKCVGCTLCCEDAPELFDWDDDVRQAWAAGEVSLGLEHRARDAVRFCPVQAILLTESERPACVGCEAPAQAWSTEPCLDCVAEMADTLERVADHKGAGKRSWWQSLGVTCREGRRELRRRPDQSSGGRRRGGQDEAPWRVCRTLVARPGKRS
jgi:ferredoxin